MKLSRIYLSKWPRVHVELPQALRGDLSPGIWGLKAHRAAGPWRCCLSQLLFCICHCHLADQVWPTPGCPTLENYGAGGWGLTIRPWAMMKKGPRATDIISPGGNS